MRVSVHEGWLSPRSRRARDVADELPAKAQRGRRTMRIGWQLEPLKSRTSFAAQIGTHPPNASFHSLPSGHVFAVTATHAVPFSSSVVPAAQTGTHALRLSLQTFPDAH